MKPVQLVYLLLFCTFCKEKTSVEQILSNHQAQLGDISRINNITTKAACESPEGKYITRTTSDFTSDYLLFQQDYHFKDNPFYAVIYSKEKGYGLDTALNSQGKLSEPVIAVLKAHEFHELALQVQDRYTNMQPAPDTSFFDIKCTQITAVDHLNYPVRLFFNSKTGRMEGISQKNPYQKGELIRVHFTDWQRVGEVLLFQKVTVAQGQQLYYFVYQDITLNDPAFHRINIEK